MTFVIIIRSCYFDLFIWGGGCMQRSDWLPQTVRVETNRETAEWFIFIETVPDTVNRILKLFLSCPSSKQLRSAAYIIHPSFISFAQQPCEVG